MRNQKKAAAERSKTQAGHKSFTSRAVNANPVSYPEASYGPGNIHLQNSWWMLKGGKEPT